MDDFRAKFNISLDDLPNLNADYFKKNGANVLLAQYPSYFDCIKTSLRLFFLALFSNSNTCVVYKERQWNQLDFKSKPKDFWKKLENQREFIKRLEKKFAITDPKSWLEIKVEDFKASGGHNLLKHYKTFPSILEASMYILIKLFV